MRSMRDQMSLQSAHHGEYGQGSGNVWKIEKYLPDQALSLVRAFFCILRGEGAYKPSGIYTGTYCFFNETKARGIMKAERKEKWFMQKFVYEYATKVYFGEGAVKEHLAEALS